MFEFINNGILIISMLLIISMHIIIQGSGSFSFLNNYLKIYIVFLVLLNCYLPYNSMQNAKLNETAFKSGKNLRCINADSTFDISKKQNWIIEKNRFLKDKIIVKTNLCKIIDA